MLSFMVGIMRLSWYDVLVRIVVSYGGLVGGFLFREGRGFIYI